MRRVAGERMRERKESVDGGTGCAVHSDVRTLYLAYVCMHSMMYAFFVYLFVFCHILVIIFIPKGVYAV